MATLNPNRSPPLHRRFSDVPDDLGGHEKEISPVDSIRQQHGPANMATAAETTIALSA
jgi:hypothetical protein